MKAWLATRNDGYQMVDVLEDTPSCRRLRRADGSEILISPRGIPCEDLHPALFYGNKRPIAWTFRGRSLPMVDIDSFPNPKQARELVPAEEPYWFRPDCTTKVIDGILAGDHQFLVGHKGCGKTSLVLQLAARIGMPVVRINFTGNLMLQDLMGSTGLDKNGTIFNDGPVLTAMRNGYWLLADEFDFGKPEVLSAFHQVLEPNPSYTVKENKGEVVRASRHALDGDGQRRGFAFFATGNGVGGERDVYVGTERMNPALLDRFSGHGQFVLVSAMKPREERKAIIARMPELPTSIVRRAVKFAEKARDNQLPDLSTRELLNFCHKLVLYRNPVEAACLTFLATIEDKDKRKAIGAEIKLCFGSRVIIGRTRITPVNTNNGNDSATSEESIEAKGHTLASLRKKGVLRDAALVIQKARSKGLSWQNIENDAVMRKAGLRPLGLRSARGMTAHRINYEWNKEALRTVKP